MIRIELFNHKNASDAEYAAATEFSNTIRAEVLPDDPPIPLAERIAAWRNIPAFVDVSSWYVWREDRSEIIGGGNVSFLRKEENRHVVDFGIWVLPEFRRQGIARRLLALIVDVPRREGRRLMITSTQGAVPAGEVFMRRLGAHMARANHMNQLDVADLHRDLLRQWQERARERASDFELGLWEGEYPEDELEEVAAMFDAMNRAPRGDLQVEDFHWTPEEIRAFERRARARGNQIWTMYVRERGSRRFAGFTEVAWHPNRPHLLDQYGTAVFPQYQNRGLGRWLKAAMLEKVLRERPQVQYVRTGNADMNAPMLKINRELGFVPYRSDYTWQVETEKVVGYLRSRGSGA